MKSIYEIIFEELNEIDPDLMSKILSEIKEKSKNKTMYTFDQMLIPPDDFLTEDEQDEQEEAEYWNSEMKKDL